MLTETEFARLLMDWRNQFGEDRRGKMVVPVESGPRILMFKTLIKTLIETHGYTEDDLMGKTYRMVIEASMNPNSPGAETWRKLASDDWIGCIGTFFPSKFAIHDPNQEVRQALPARIEEPKPEVVPEPVVDEGPMALSQEDFDLITDIVKGEFDTEFLADMMSVPASKLSDKQTKRLNKLRKKATNLQKVKEKSSTQKIRDEEEQESREVELVQENPVDRSLVEGLPPVVDIDNEDFFKQFAVNGGDNE